MNSCYNLITDDSAVLYSSGYRYILLCLCNTFLPCFAQLQSRCGWCFIGSLTNDESTSHLDFYLCLVETIYAY